MTCIWFIHRYNVFRSNKPELSLISRGLNLQRTQVDSLMQGMRSAGGRWEKGAGRGRGKGASGRLKNDFNFVFIWAEEQVPEIKILLESSWLGPGGGDRRWVGRGPTHLVVVW